MDQFKVDREKMELVDVTHIEDAITFWAHNVSVDQAIEQISNTLADICPKAQCLFGIPSPQKIYGALFSEDKCWYRCKVQQHTDDKFNVSYIDYGNTEVVGRSALVELPDPLQSPCLANKYKIWGFHISTDHDSSVFKQGKAFLQNVIYGKRVHIQKKSVCFDGTILVQAFQGNLDIGEELLKMKFAMVNLPGSNPNGPLSLRALQGPSAPLVQQLQVERDRGDEMSAFPVSMPKLRPVLTDQTPQSVKEANAPNASQPANVPKEIYQDLLEENQSLKADLNVQKQNFEEKEKELEDAYSELQRLKEKSVIDAGEAESLKTMADEVKSESQQLRKQVYDAEFALQAVMGEILKKEKEMDELLDTAVAEQFCRLVVKADALRGLREKSPCNGDGGKLMESINTVIHNRISAPVAIIGKLDVAWRDYSLAQEKLEACETKEEVEDLINHRNEMKSVLMDMVEAFLKEAKVLPVRKRMETLQEVGASLTAVFGPLSEEDVGDHIFEEYYQWMKQRQEHINSIRDDTDKALNALSTWTLNVSKFVCLSRRTPVTVKDMVEGVTDILKRAKLSMCKELDVSESATDKNNQRCPVVTSAFHKVMQHIEEEKRALSDIMEQYLINLKFKGEMLQWQNASPTPATLFSIKKHIRALRSQLRWKQVEEGSLEEAEELDLIEISKKKEEIAETRKALFQEIGREKEEYKKLSALVEDGFPELPLLYPEADIGSFMSSGGLLVKSLDRDMFDAEPMKELSDCRPLVCTEFQGQRVILKSYTINEDTEVRVLEQATQFHCAKTESKEDAGILPLLALFFSKSDPVVHVMVPYFPHGSLKAVQAVNPLTPTEVAKVMKGVAQGLQALHALGVTHGSLNPNNVFVKDRDCGLVGDFDFTKTPGQRAMSSGMGGSISLVAPELRQGTAIPSPACDMYSFGCLMLWLHVPEFNNAQDNLESLKLEPKLQSLLPKLLVSEGRLTAGEVLDNEYFVAG